MACASEREVWSARMSTPRCRSRKGSQTHRTEVVSTVSAVAASSTVDTSFLLVEEGRNKGVSTGDEKRLDGQGSSSTHDSDPVPDLEVPRVV